MLNALQIQPSIQLPAKRRRTGEHATALEAVKLAVGLVEDEFGFRAAASEDFPPDITSSHIRTSVSRYEDEMSSAAERSVCCCCGRFIAAGDIYEVRNEARFILRQFTDTPLTICKITETPLTSYAITETPFRVISDAHSCHLRYIPITFSASMIVGTPLLSRDATHYLLPTPYLHLVVHKGHYSSGLPLLHLDHYAVN